MKSGTPRNNFKYDFPQRHSSLAVKAIKMVDMQLSNAKLVQRGINMIYGSYWFGKKVKQKGIAL